MHCPSGLTFHYKWQVKFLLKLQGSQKYWVQFAVSTRGIRRKGSGTQKTAQYYIGSVLGHFIMVCVD